MLGPTAQSRGTPARNVNAGATPWRTASQSAPLFALQSSSGAKSPTPLVRRRRGGDRDGGIALARS
jgi:hypothetical protein